MFVASILCLLLIALLVWVYVTNPFNRFTVMRLPFVVHQLEPLQVTDRLKHLRVHRAWWWRWLAKAKCGLHILHTRYISSPRSAAQTVPAIINDIHALRFRPDKLLLISGDHFNGLFVRNLGVFYYPTLDRAIPATPEQWRNRQLVYAQSVAYALGVFAKHPVPTTTIVETGRYSAVCVNFYAFPSDTVYGILYALAALKGLESAQPAGYAAAVHTLQTPAVAAHLLQAYQSTLQELYNCYRRTAFDETLGLIDPEIHLSGAKDITRRRSAFFDNVIFWKTTQLAMRLGVITDDQAFLRALKKRIISTFWLPEEGYFLEDLSEEGKAQKYYSSDWLIILATGFLDPAKKTDRPYFTRSIAYLQAQAIDRPFPLKYQAETRAHRQFFAVRVAVASYGGDAIWSFWGMEYIKALLLLYKATGNRRYLRTADRHIASYKKVMRHYGGFPEVYDNQGRLLQTPLYRSIRQTGWVIGFEQVLAMRAAIR